MRTRPVPGVATGLLKLFCSSAEYESQIGDLQEQYQFGRGRLWYWRQVLVILGLGLYGKAVRRPLVPSHRIHLAHGFALILLIAALAAVLVSDIWVLGVVAILGGSIAATLIFGFRPGPGRTPPYSPASDAASNHPGISISHIPVEGAVGLLVVLATASIFVIGIPAIREILIVTVPLGVLGAGILLYWHKRHPREIQVLDLHSKERKGMTT